MRAMIQAAFRYFGLIFALGFLLGTLRTLWLAPVTGTTGAVLIELPVMLLASWIVARRIVTSRRMRPPAALGMGLLAFLLLMIAEAVLAMALAGQSLTQWAADLTRTPGWIGLTGQLLFGLIPWLLARGGGLRPAGN